VLAVVPLLLLAGAFVVAWSMGVFNRDRKPPVPPEGGGQQTFVNNPPDRGKVNWPPPVEEPKYTPIKAPHFREPKGIIETFEKEPGQEWLRTVAGQLALTEPTEEQTRKHEDYKRLKFLVETDAGSKEARDKAAREDDVLIVSRGLKKAKPTDLPGKINLVRALQKWGTEENVEQLIELTEAEGFGADAVRIGACKALARIPDQNGADAVAARFVSGWAEERQGVTDALLAYKDPKYPEKGILNCFKGNVTTVNWPHDYTRIRVQYGEKAKEWAIDVLSKIGSPKSLNQLNDLRGHPTCGKAALMAIDEIKKRHPDAKDD
jgi:hypothetical protein